MNKFLAAAIFLISTAIARADAPNVIASFKPVHSLVAAVMQGIGEPYLLVKGAASPHAYSMTPSDAKALQDARIIFWIGPELEAFLPKPLQALGGAAKIVALEDADGLERLPLRDPDGAIGTDPHVWLDPENARLMLRQIARTLAETDPANAPAYEANAVKADAALSTLRAELDASLALAKNKPFLTFHDAFQYFNRRFDLDASGSITLNPESPPGAARVAQLRDEVKQRGINCVFAEPNFEPKIVNAIIEGSTAKIATLDPEASALTAGPELYFQSLRGIAKSMRECLGG